MKHKEKTLIRITLFIAFIFLGIFLTLSSLGIEIDFSSLTLKKTGSIFLSYNKRDATLIINGVVEKVSPSLLTNSVLINRLKPGTYKIEIFLPGYFPYKKQLEVKSGLVTQLRDITLHPLSRDEIIIASSTVENINISNLGLILDKGKIITLETGKPIKGMSIKDSSVESSFVITEDENYLYATNMHTPSISTNISSLSRSLINHTPFSSHKIQTINLYPGKDGYFIIETDKTFLSLNIENPTISEISTLKELNIDGTIQHEKFCLPSVNKKKLTFVDLGNKTKTSLFLEENIKQLINHENSCFILTEKKNILKIEDAKIDFQIDSPTNEIDSIIESKSKTFFAIIGKDGNIYIGTTKHDNENIFTNNKTAKLLPLNKGRITKAEFLPNNERELLIETETGLYISERDIRGENTNSTLISTGPKKYIVREDKIYLLFENGTVKSVDIK